MQSAMTTARRKKLFLPSVPTPNGPLHLGHIAGPYLKMDVARRLAQRAGHDAVMIGGFDVFDSYIASMADREGITPSELCARNIARIKTDLHSLDIEFDGFVDLLSGPDLQVYQQSLRRILDGLASTGHVAEESELLPLDEQGRPLIGSRLAGNCPFCGAPASGFSCEQCGQHLKPADLISAGHKLSGSFTAHRQNTKLFRMPDAGELARCATLQTLPEPFLEIVQSYLKRRGIELRITMPGTWGVSLAPAEDGNVIYSGFASLAGMLVADHLYQQKNGGVSAFDPQGDVDVVCSFGVDNLVARTISTVAVPLALGSVRPPGLLWVNRFYNLDGDKFSTSRKNAIWVQGIAQALPQMPDMLRFYLLRTAPGVCPTNFTLQEFVGVSNEMFAGRLNSVLARSRSFEAESRGSCPSDVHERTVAALRLQDDVISSANTDWSRVAEQVSEWISYTQEIWKPRSLYWGLKALALISSPVLTRFAANLWSALGGVGAPAEAGFDLDERLGQDFELTAFPELSLDSLQQFHPGRLHE